MTPTGGFRHVTLQRQRIGFGPALWLAVLALLMGGISTSAQTLPEQPLPLDGAISADGREVTLDWSDTPRAHRGVVEISRRQLGETGPETWRPIAPKIGPGMRAMDTTTEPGIAYEYRVLRLKAGAGDAVLDAGYWTTGRQIPAVERPGHVYLILDQTLAPALAAHLRRFRADLTGQGWTTHALSVPREKTGTLQDDLQTVFRTKQVLAQAFKAAPHDRHVVILVGRVPLLRSGQAAPDGHESVPHPTDLIYGDVDGRWRIDTEGNLLDTRVPSDFIEMQVGRIDFYRVSQDNPEMELRLLRAYFDKVHHWRMGWLGDPREAYGQDESLVGEIYGLRNIVGPEAVSEGGHHDIGEQKHWLWGVDFGDSKGENYLSDHTNKATFVINFGSSKQKIGRHMNAMVAHLAQPFYPLTVGWGGRPAWWLHAMALGRSIGDAHMRTVNNGRAEDPYPASMDYIPPGRYPFPNAIWVNLLGDPTLQGFVLPPPQLVQAHQIGDEVRLSWQAPDTGTGPANVLGYKVYRAGPEDRGFVVVSGPEPIEALEFLDADPAENASYMVRAYGLQETYAGSFYTYSTGVLARPDRALSDAPDMWLSGARDAPLALPPGFGAPENDRIYTVIAPPSVGELKLDVGGWVYHPPLGFAGEVALLISVWDNALQSRTGTLTLSIGD
ncbi:MAG: hypothetical protein AAGI03_06490 [Pseudomonadota bacterium]